jgi:hypothetical protein
MFIPLLFVGFGKPRLTSEVHYGYNGDRTTVARSVGPTFLLPFFFFLKTAGVTTRKENTRNGLKRT